MVTACDVGLGAVKAIASPALLSGDRVWSGVGRSLHVEGRESIRLNLGLYEVELNR